MLRLKNVEELFFLFWCIVFDVTMVVPYTFGVKNLEWYVLGISV